MEPPLPDNVTLVSNDAGITGGVALWHDTAVEAPAPSGSAPRRGGDLSKPQVAARPSDLPGIDLHDLAEELDGLGLGTLERIAADDRTEPAAGLDAANLVEQSRILGMFAAREDDDAAPAERALHHMLDALGRCADRNVLGLVDLLRGRLFDMGARAVSP